jgi:hypothetical protein
MIGEEGSTTYEDESSIGYPALCEKFGSFSPELEDLFTKVLSIKMEEQGESQPTAQTMRNALVAIFLPTFTPKDEAGKVKKLLNMQLSGGTSISSRRAVVGDTHMLRGIAASMVELVNGNDTATVVDIFGFPAMPSVLRIIFPVVNGARNMQLNTLNTSYHIRSRNRQFLPYVPVYFFLTIGRGNNQGKKAEEKFLEKI